MRGFGVLVFGASRSAWKTKTGDGRAGKFMLFGRADIRNARVSVRCRRRAARTECLVACAPVWLTGVPAKYMLFERASSNLVLTAPFFFGGGAGGE